MGFMNNITSVFLTAALCIMTVSRISLEEKLYYLFDPGHRTYYSHTVSYDLQDEEPDVTEAPAVTEVTKPVEIKKSCSIDVKCIFQEPELPTGCEVTSLTMLLNYLGFDISKTELAADYLPMDYGGRVGFDRAFIGNPEWYGGYGCFSPVIETTANRYLSEKNADFRAVDIAGTEFEELYRYICMDMPVVVWCSMDLVSLNYRFAFTDSTGNDIYWYENEHCVLLCGYDTENGTVTVDDPLNGRVQYSTARFKEIYNELGRQAVIIEPEKQNG